MLINSIHYKDYIKNSAKLHPSARLSKNLRFDYDYRNALFANSDLVKILSLCLEQLPGILHESICTAFRSQKSLLNDYNNINIKDKLYTHRSASQAYYKIKHLDTILDNLNFNYEMLTHDLMNIAKSQNMAEMLVSNSNNVLMAVIESRLKIHQKEHTDILKPFKSRREYQEHINSICAKLYPDGQKITVKLPKSENNLVFEEILESVSYFKRCSIISSLNKNYALAQTTMLAIAFYLIALRSMFKIQTPMMSLCVAYTPVQIVPSLALGALSATSRVIEFMCKNSKIPAKNFALPRIKDFITVLKYFIQGTIKIMYCGSCGSTSLVFTDSIGTDMLDNGFLFLCHTCETGQKDRFIFIDNVVKYDHDPRLKFYLGTKRKISRNTIANNTRHLNCYNQNYLGALEFMTRNFSGNSDISI